jgi:hypothetical protein
MVEAVNLYVVPSTWVFVERAQGELRSVHMPEPYSRVVGMKTPAGDRLWVAPTHPEDREAYYDPEDAEEKAVALEPIHRRRLAAIFNRFMVYGTQTAEGLNCDRFVRLMSGNEEWPGTDVAQAEVEALITAGTIVDRNLRLGERGDFGSKRPDDTPVYHHAVFGLGEDNEECLQIMGASGHLAVMTYDSIGRFYGERYSMLSDFGMYVVETTGVPPLEQAA